MRASVRDQGRTEDVVQEVFFSAHSRLATLSDPAAFRSWLYQIARNACLDDVRRRSRDDALILGWDEFPPPDERIVFHNQGPEHQLSQKEELADLTKALGGLPASQHEALVLRELGGMSYEEIGDRMALSPGAVESVLFRARRGLRRAFSRAAAFLPFPALLGRRAGSAEQPAGSSSLAEQAQGAAAQLPAVSPDQAVSLVHKAAAVVAAVAVVGGGTAAIEQAGVKIPVLDSTTTKSDHAKARGPAAAGAVAHGAAATVGSAPTGGVRRPKIVSGAPGVAPAAVGQAAAPLTTNAASPAVSGPAAPQASLPTGSGAPPSAGLERPQASQPTPKVDKGPHGGGSSNSKQTTTAPSPPPHLTTPTGEPIPPQLPPGIQKQLESGKRTLDDLPPGLKKKLAEGLSNPAMPAAP